MTGTEKYIFQRDNIFLQREIIIFSREIIITQLAFKVLGRIFAFHRDLEMNVYLISMTIFKKIQFIHFLIEISGFKKNSYLSVVIADNSILGIDL